MTLKILFNVHPHSNLIYFLLKIFIDLVLINLLDIFVLMLIKFIIIIVLILIIVKTKVLLIMDVSVMNVKINLSLISILMIPLMLYLNLMKIIIKILYTANTILFNGTKIIIVIKCLNILSLLLSRLEQIWA